MLRKTKLRLAQTANRRLYGPPLGLFFVCIAIVGKAAAEPAYDVVIYGGTSSGVIAAVQVARMGKSAILIEPGKHLGGLTSGGLGATDIGNKAAIGGLAREFYRRVRQHYAQLSAWKFERANDYQSRRQAPGEDSMWTFEPHVAEDICRALLAEARVPVLFGERLDLTVPVAREGTRIVKLKMESGREFAGKIVIDASYEGDVMARAGVSYHVGREANAQYRETINGVQLGSKKHQFKVNVDPYVVPGDPSSGLLPGIHGGSPGRHGEADDRVQAYCFRMCLTDVPENRLPVPRPAGYDPLRYELLLRTILAGQWDGLGNPLMMPNRKTDTNNNGAFSSDDIGMNYAYPDGDYATRERIYREHVTYQQGWLWFLANDPRVPERIRTQTAQWGLPKDEFVETGGWPHQLYIREARRMISDCVMTEHHCRGDATVPDSVGLAAYGMDSHNTQRYVAGGFARNEGDVEVGGFAPYPIAYRSIVPRQRECENLIVPVCLSASHIAYGSIRMEPVLMVLGQSAATAACHAVDERCAVQQVDAGRLRARLLADGQVLEWTGRMPHRGKGAKTLPGVVVDDSDAELTGDWTTSRTIDGFVGIGYRHDNNEKRGDKRARFTATLLTSGLYEVRMAYTAAANRASRVLVTVHAADQVRRITVDERKPPPGNEGFLSLGQFRFDRDMLSAVEVSNADANGYVVIDAVQWLPVAEPAPSAK